jgi:hypothetical protein
VPYSLYAAAAAAFAIQGVGLSTYHAGGYADSSVVELAERAVMNGADHVVLSNIVLADLKTGRLSEIVENGVRQTASLADVERAIQVAHAAGAEVMLKPQVAVHDPAFDRYNSASWINMVNPDLTIADPDAFFASYKAHLVEWARLAERRDVELLSIGNEMVAATKPQYAGYWNDIIDAVRSVYRGKLVYSALAPVMTSGGANEITQITFWDRLDYAGFDVYPSLTRKRNPTVQDLEAGWRDAVVFGQRQDYAAFLGKMAAVTGKPVIFTETGLPSFEGASDREATSDGDIGAGARAADQQEQADWWQAFFKTWAVDRPAWLHGVIVNNNDPGDLGAYWEQNYNIDGKLAEKVVTAWFGGSTVIHANAAALTGGQGNDRLFLFGPQAPDAGAQAASLTTRVSVKAAASILGGASPSIHAYVNGVDLGRAALKPLDSGYVDAAGIHFTATQTFTFELPGLVRVDQLRIGVEAEPGASVFFHEIQVNGVALPAGVGRLAGDALIRRRGRLERRARQPRRRRRPRSDRGERRRRGRRGPCARRARALHHHPPERRDRPVVGEQRPWPERHPARGLRGGVRGRLSGLAIGPAHRRRPPVRRHPRRHGDGHPLRRRRRLPSRARAVLVLRPRPAQAPPKEDSMTDRPMPDQKPEAGALQLPALPRTPTQAAMKATLQAYVDAANRDDAAGLLALFAPGATIEDPVGSPPKSGPEIAAWFETTAALRTRITPVAPSRGSFSNEAALIFDVTYDTGGRRLKTRTLDVCVFDEEARITSLRAFWGPEEVEDLGPAAEAVIGQQA